MKQVILFGNSPSAVMTYYQLTDDPEYSVKGFTVDKDYIKDKSLFGLPVLPFDSIEDEFSPEHYDMLIAIAYTQMNQVREQKYKQAKSKGFNLISYVHPTAIVYPEVTIGENCQIGPYTVIQQDTIIGDNVIIRDGCHIGHNNCIEDHCFISANTNVSGHVSIESNSFLGASCTIKDRLTIKKSSLIGAGVTILNDTEEKDVYVNRTCQKLPFPSDRFLI